MTFHERQNGMSLDLFPGHKQNEQQRSFSELDYIKEELELKGFCVLKDKIKPSEVNACKSDIDQLLLAEEKKFGAEALVNINDHGVVRSPFLSSTAIRNLCFNSFARDLLFHIFGDQYLLHVNRAVVNDPERKHPASIWHREPPYVDFTASRVLALTFVHILDKSSAENGGLALLPGSHLWQEFPSDRYVQNNAQLPDISAGSILVFNSLLFHCGTKNIGYEKRRSLVTVYTVPVIKQQVNIPVMMTERGQESLVDEFPNGRFFYGFDTILRTSDDEYRQHKLSNIDESPNIADE